MPITYLGAGQTLTVRNVNSLDEAYTLGGEEKC